MAEAMFMDDAVCGFLHNIEDPGVSGNELLQSLDKVESLFPLHDSSKTQQGTANSSSEKDTKGEKATATTATDSDWTSVETRSIASSSSSPQNTVEMDCIRSRDAIRRSTYRQKQKAHKDALYKLVEELSTQLETLLKNQEAAKAVEGVGFTKTAVWKALATRNLQARLTAEEQRRRLREAIEKRSELIQDLGDIIRKRISEEPLGDGGHFAKKPRTKSPDMALYEAYINELDEVYARTESIFKETTMQIDTYEDAKLYYNPARPGADYHELVGAFSTPFAFERVKEHLPKVCCMEHHPGYELIVGTWVPENTIITKARYEAPGGSCLVQHCILRRYYECERLVLVWRKFTEGEDVFAGMHSDETGWCIVRSSASCVGASPVTVLESVIRFVPINFRTAATSSAIVKQFADVIIKSGEDICQSGLNKLEEILLDDALGGC